MKHYEIHIDDTTGKCDYQNMQRD